MIEKYVMPGQRLELQAVHRGMNDGKEENKKVYASSVFDVLSEDRLDVVMPMEKTKLILLPVGAEYEVFFYTERGLYECITRVIDRYKSNHVYLLTLELVTNLRKYQRREYYRFSCVLDMYTRILAKEEVVAVEKNEWHSVPGLPLKRSVIVDISGGGIRFISSFPYETGNYIYCNYCLQYKEEERNYEIVCRVLDVQELENRPGEYTHRAQYVGMNTKTREEIIQFIFEAERRNRQ